MENASDALIMAGSVLLLIIALTVSISSFSNLKIQTDEIISQRYKLQDTTTSDGEFLNYLKSSNDKDVRTVQIENIITAFRRLRKEQYIIYIVPKTTMPSGIPAELKTTISENQYYGGSIIVSKNKEVIELSMSGEKNKFTDGSNRDMVIKNLYNGLKDKKFKEYLGVFQYKASTGVSEVNKHTYKIITFVETT